MENGVTTERTERTVKILIGQVMHETNTFSSVKTTVESFKQWEWCEGAEIIRRHRGVQDFIGGMIDQCAAYGFDIIPTFSATANPSGIIAADTYAKIKKALFAHIEAASHFDAVCLALHGAGVAEGIDDLEGDLLHAVRKAIGDDIPLVVTLDLHANLTEEMVREADVLLGNEDYPHTDSYERGREAVQVAKQLFHGTIRPVTRFVKLPLLIPTSTTEHHPAKSVKTACQEREKDENVIDCTFFHGFPYTDIPQLGAAVLVTTHNAPQLAEAVAEEISDKIWAIREAFFPRYPSPEEGLRMAERHKGKPVIINETSDNPGAGAPGDGTQLLKAMLDAKIAGSCFGFLCDPEAAAKAHAAGVGSTIEVKLGGKTDGLHGMPLSVKAYVKCLTDGRFTLSTPMGRGKRVNLGKSARLDIEGVDVVVCSVTAQTLDEQIFLLHGIDVRQYKIVALKSSHHFRAGFGPISSKIISVDSPGLSTMDVTAFAFTKLNRNVYPLHAVKRT